MIEIPANLKAAGEPDSSVNYQSIHDECIVDLSEEIKMQPIAISIGEHHYKNERYATPFGSYGDFSCIVGASKSKKTFFKSLLTAAYIGGNATNYCGEIKGHKNEDKYVIEFDTEQSKFHSQRVFRRVIEMVGYNYPKYVCFQLRGKTPVERMALINWVFNESKYKDSIGLAVIDGVADLVNDANSLEQANDLVTNLLIWSDKAQCHIITILHRNFQSNKPTGHVGSAVLKKAETVAFIEKEDDFVKVTAEYTRNIAFDEFTFGVDSQSWLPYVNDGSNNFNF